MNFLLKYILSSNSMHGRKINSLQRPVMKSLILSHVSPLSNKFKFQPCNQSHLKMGNPWVPMGTHLVYCKYLFSNQILSDKMHIGWKLHYFYIYSYKQHCHIGNVSRDIEGFLINPQLKCFEIFLIFHGLLLWLQKEIVMEIFVNRSQEYLEKNSWVPITMLCM